MGMSDRVERKDVKKAFFDYHGESEREIRQMVNFLIDSIPSAETTGHWILAKDQSKEDTENGNYRYVCSECDHSDIHAKTQEVPYCWYCGTKMVGDTE